MVTVSEAVKTLRAAYGEAQQAFSNRLHMSLASIANYELGVRVPDAISARKLYLAALLIDRDDLAAVFAKVVAEALGELQFWDVVIQSESEHWKIRAVQRILSDPQFERLQKPLAKLLAPVEKYIQELAARQRVASEDMPNVIARMYKRQQGKTDPWGEASKAREQGKGKK